MSPFPAPLSPIPQKSQILPLWCDFFLNPEGKALALSLRSCFLFFYSSNIYNICIYNIHIWHRSINVSLYSKYLILSHKYILSYVNTINIQELYQRLGYDKVPQASAFLGSICLPGNNLPST